MYVSCGSVFFFYMGLLAYMSTVFDNKLYEFYSTVGHTDVSVHIMGIDVLMC